MAGTKRPEKKRTVIWPAMFFSGFKLQPEILQQETKNVQSSGHQLETVKNYDRKKNLKSSGRQLETGKNYIRKKKGTVVSTRPIYVKLSDFYVKLNVSNLNVMHVY